MGSEQQPAGFESAGKVLSGKPSAYETGKSHGRAGRATTEQPFDPNSPDDAVEYRRGYSDGAAEKSRDEQAAAREGA